MRIPPTFISSFITPVFFRKWMGVFLMITVALSHGGCGFFPLMNKTPRSEPQANWKTLAGQMQYRDAKRSFVAEVTIRTDEKAENYSMLVTKAGARLLELDRRGESGWARGVASGIPYAGKIDGTPAHLKRWFTATDAAIATNLAGKKATALPPGSSGETTIDFRLQP